MLVLWFLAMHVTALGWAIVATLSSLLVACVLAIVRLWAPARRAGLRNRVHRLHARNTQESRSDALAELDIALSALDHARRTADGCPGEANLTSRIADLALLRDTISVTRHPAPGNARCLADDSVGYTDLAELRSLCEAVAADVEAGRPFEPELEAMSHLIPSVNTRRNLPS